MQSGGEISGQLATWSTLMEVTVDIQSNRNFFHARNGSSWEPPTWRFGLLQPGQLAIAGLSNSIINKKALSKDMSILSQIDARLYLSRFKTSSKTEA